MPQSLPELPTDVKIYSAPDEWLKHFLLVLVSLTGYVVLAGPRAWKIYQSVGLIPQLQFILIGFGILMVFVGFVFFQAFIRRKWRYEVGPEGIARLEGKGVRRLIRWDQVGEVKEDMSGGNLTIRDREGRNRFLITRMVTGFDELKRSVYAAWGQGPERVSPVSGEEGQVFAPAKSVKTSGWIGGLFFLSFSLLCAVGAVGILCGFIQGPHSPLFAFIIFTLCFAFFTVLAVYFLFVALKFSQDKIELSSQGIARLKGDGRRVFIPWDDIGCLTKRERMKQLGVYDLSGAQKIMVDYQFERFDLIRDRILEEREKRFRIPPLPITYGRLPVLPNLGLLGFFGSSIAFMCWIEFNLPTTGGTGSFLLVIVMFVVFYLASLFSEAKLVKALTLGGEGVVLHRLFGKSAVPWAELQNVELDSATGRGGRYMFVKITTMAGKEFVLSAVIGTQLDAYIAMKKMLVNKP